jgi:hypothetical protein
VPPFRDWHSSPVGCDENGPAAALLVSHVSRLDMLLRTASPARTALLAAHFDRNAAIPVTEGGR